MTFHAGQRVVCVDDSRPNVPCLKLAGAPLVKDATYTIRSAGTERQGLPVVCLMENTLTHPEYDGEIPWLASRFRPVEEITTTEDAIQHQEMCV